MDGIRKNIQPKLLNHLMIYVESTNSTNDEVERILSRENLPDGSFLRTDFQKQGKGMLDNTWESESGKNLLMSILFYHTSLPINKQFFLSKTITLALFDSVSKITLNKDIKIKWPNDIMVDKEKLAGILIKNSVKNELVNHSIIGIGLNVNQAVFSESFSATSLKNLSGKAYNLEEITSLLLSTIDTRMIDLRSGKYSKINQDYHNSLLSYKTWESYNRNGSNFEGKILEVGDDGRVIIEKRDGSFQKYEVKEISLNPE